MAFNFDQPENKVADVRLGRRPAKSNSKALHFAQFVRARQLADPPEQTTFWSRRRSFPIRSFGNREHGDCTIAKQAVAAMRMERLETRQTPKIADQAVIDVYYRMTDRLYGGGDTGAYETDALDNWRNPELTFRDTKGRPLTIDAYVAVNPKDHREVKRASATAGAHGLEVCFNLPWAWARLGPGELWDVERDDNGKALPPVGDYEPGTWGGHSMHMYEYERRGPVLDMTWDMPAQPVTWEAASYYMDEVHLVIDSLDYWRKHKPEAKRLLYLAGIRDAVNAVSDIRIV
jgi:hypothetical protein